ncbi:hypothetical protein SUGI_0266080 [Cryptomeria japonica]|uniref:uncharacterized protein LOC131068484 n=1 Tax=Cryptomeria japonica TaxID=3369 RepID=UPI0024089895|nr:uncharacterized protein LOC131068484 [Cryptomeria japonica]GLJ16035.1 hypothetical protein SUGI_0266080 [Cryptomeria japonica]
MSTTLDNSSSSEDTPNDSNHDDSIEYLRISDYEPISSENPTQDNSVDLHNHNNADGFQPVDSVVQNADNGTTISYNGIEIHVFGNANGFIEAGLQISNGSHSNHNTVDTEEEEEEDRLREEAQKAIREANRADAERRNAPLPPQTSSAIMNAMRGISLQGFRPDWVDTVPEHQWIDQLRRRSREAPPQT